MNTNSNTSASSHVLQQKSAPAKLQVIPIGGVEEIAINCTAIRYENQLFIIDTGLGFSDVDHFGIDYLIPNYEYLQQHKSEVAGIFITHGHLDHIGAIEYFARELGFPKIFAPAFAMELIRLRLEEAGILDQCKLIQITDKEKLTFGPVSLDYFRVNHSIPDSYGIIVRTPEGNIVHTGDFKFDNSPLNEPKADYYKLTKLSREEGVLLMLSDSTNSFREGHSISELNIMGTLDEVVAGAQGRVIVATFASLVTRLYALVEIAKKYKRKIYITGRSMMNSIEISRRLGYITADDDMFVFPGQANKLNDSRLMVLATGSQGEGMSALARMSRGEHRDISIKKGDTVILSSSVIPGNDGLVQKLIDEISRLGAKVFHQEIMNLHTSGHGFIEDQKLMINLVNPQFFMPVHGFQYFLNRHAQTAVEVGVKKENVIIAERGDIIEINKSGWKKNGRVKNLPIPISGSGVGDVGPLILQDREKLAANGLVVFNILIAEDGNKKKLLHEPGIYSRGFVFVRDNPEIMRELYTEVKKILHNNLQAQMAKEGWIAKVRGEIEQGLADVIKHLTEREPLLISNIDIVSAENITNRFADKGNEDAIDHKPVQQQHRAPKPAPVREAVPAASKEVAKELKEVDEKKEVVVEDDLF